MLSQIPWVILARVLAEQGATRTTSAQRRSWERERLRVNFSREGVQAESIPRCAAQGRRSLTSPVAEERYR